MGILIPVTFFIDVTRGERILLIMSLFIVLIAELLNSTIKALADRMSTEVHGLIGKAKDIGSAVVGNGGQKHVSDRLTSHFIVKRMILWCHQAVVH